MTPPILPCPALVLLLNKAPQIDQPKLTLDAAQDVRVGAVSRRIEDIAIKIVKVAHQDDMIRLFITLSHATLNGVDENGGLRLSFRTALWMVWTRL